MPAIHLQQMMKSLTDKIVILWIGFLFKPKILVDVADIDLSCGLDNPSSSEIHTVNARGRTDFLEVCLTCII